MASWTDTPDLGNYLLPAGDNTATIAQAITRNNPHTGNLEGWLTLAIDGASGDVSVPLQPWDTTEQGLATFDRIVKAQAAGLGFEPNDPAAEMVNIAGGEFADYIHLLTGKAVNVQIEHVQSAKLKDNGTPFVNHRVYFKGLVGARELAAA